MAQIKAELAIPEGVQVDVSNSTVTVKGPKGELKRQYPHYYVKITKEANKVVFEVSKQQMKQMVGTWQSHVKNMINGVQKPFVYKLKICSSHFPMSVKLQGNDLTVQNFCGEHSPRKIKLAPGANIKVAGEMITIESPDIELAGKVANLIEQKVQVGHKDRRIFQDGIYIIEKAGKQV